MSLTDQLMARTRAMHAELAACMASQQADPSPPATHQVTMPIPVSEEDVLYRQALRAADAGQGSEAIQILRRLAEGGSVNFEVYNVLGTLLFESGDVAGAADVFRVGSGLEFSSTKALRNLIVAYTQLGEIALALTACHLLLDKEPDDPDIPLFLRDLIAASELRFDDPTALGSSISAVFSERDELSRLRPLIHKTAAFCEYSLTALERLNEQSSPPETKPSWLPPPITLTGAKDHASVILFLPPCSGGIAVRRILAKLTASDYAFHDVDLNNWFTQGAKGSDRPYPISRRGGIYLFFNAGNLRSSLHNSGIQPGELNTIVTIRDPRDTLVSLYHLTLDTNHTPDMLTASSEIKARVQMMFAEADRVRKLTVDRYVLEQVQNWVSNLDHFRALVSGRDGADATFLSYALLCNDFPAFLGKLIDTLELSPPPALIDEVLLTEDVRKSDTLTKASLAHFKNASPLPGRHRKELSADTIEELNRQTREIRLWLGANDDSRLRCLYED